VVLSVSVVDSWSPKLAFSQYSRTPEGYTVARRLYFADGTPLTPSALSGLTDIPRTGTPARFFGEIGYWKSTVDCNDTYGRHLAIIHYVIAASGGDKPWLEGQRSLQRHPRIHHEPGSRKKLITLAGTPLHP
jgi:hypothetical protein